MPKTYYDSELTGAQIESALEAIHGVVTPSNNGKVLYIENGQIKAASASRWSGGAVLESLSVTANGDYTPPTGTDGFDSVHVAVPSATLTTKSITQNGTYNASQDNADGYSSVTVDVPGGTTVEPLEVTQNGTYNPPSGVDGYAPVTVDVSGGGNYERYILSQEDLKACVDSGGNNNYWYAKASLPIIPSFKNSSDSLNVGQEASGDNPYYKEWHAYNEHSDLYIRPIPASARRVCIDCKSIGSSSYPYSIITFRTKLYIGGYQRHTTGSPNAWTNFTKKTYTVYGITYNVLGGCALSYDNTDVSVYENQDIIEEISLTSGTNGYRTRQVIKLDVSSFDEDVYMIWYHVGLYDRVYQIWWE